MGEIERRIEADLSLLSNPMILRLVVPLAAAGAGLVLYFLWRHGRN